MAQEDAARWTRNKLRRDTRDLVNQLREAALRAIWRLERPDSPGDINPHTAGLTPYALASMLTFSRDGSSVASGGLERVKQMIVAGKLEHRKVRRDWVAWELERLGHVDQARSVTEDIDASGDSTMRCP
ncbi:MAG TPA: hypothetical protein VGL46_09660 [Pseudonocardiaceae bacterium]|jgi:hypothetical protein